MKNLHLLLGVLALVFMGCKDEPKPPAGGLQINVPGVNIKVDKDGASVSAAGVDVKAGKDGANVDVKPPK